eukprot:scaffold270828_cov32-Tisochrysis_lutea.AAC.2
MGQGSAGSDPHALLTAGHPTCFLPVRRSKLGKRAKESVQTRKLPFRWNSRPAQGLALAPQSAPTRALDLHAGEVKV